MKYKSKLTKLCKKMTKHHAVLELFNTYDISLKDAKKELDDLIMKGDL